MMQRVQQLIQQNPQLAMLLQKPGLMQKLQAIAQNPNDPMIAQQYASDPDVQQLISILGPAMGLNQGQFGGGMGSFSGMGQSQQMQQGNNINMVTHINSESQFFDIIHKSPKDKLIVVDFFANWYEKMCVFQVFLFRTFSDFCRCGPCKAIAPEFERFAKLYKQGAIFVKVDVDRHKKLSQNKGVSAMPTFQFYKSGAKIDEMRGANVRKLEELITKHISVVGSGQHMNVNLKPSPYANFPLHEKNRPVYTKAPFKKMKDKLMQLNNKFLEDEQQKQAQDGNAVKHEVKHSLDETEWKLLTVIMTMLQVWMHYEKHSFLSC